MKHELAQIGNDFVDVPPVRRRRTRVVDPPPKGAARVVRAGDHFEWEPVSRTDWQHLSAEERGQIIVDRTLAWLDVNASTLAAPLVALDGKPSAASTQLFGRGVTSLHEALCRAASYLHSGGGKTADAAIVALSVTVAAAAGVHFVGDALASISVLIRIYGDTRCGNRRGDQDAS